MPTSAPGNNVAPTLGTGVSSLPPEGAGSPWGGPAANRAPTLGTGVSSLPPEGAGSPWGGPAVDRAPTLLRKPRACGFTLIELLVVIAIIAIASAGVTFALRDSADTRLEREAQRLAALLDSARAQSRSSGVPVRWTTTEGGFRFDGVTSRIALPTEWLYASTEARGQLPLILGPEPVIGRQEVLLTSSDSPARSLRVATDGLRPFAVSSPEAAQ